MNFKFLRKICYEKLLIFVPFEDYGSIGGPSTFMQNLESFFDKRKLLASSNLEKSKVIFFPISYNIETLELLKRKGVKIIQRLDGIYYPPKHSEDFEKLNTPIKKIYQDLADHIIFQSNYSKSQCFEFFGQISPSQYTVIYNGANKSIFYPKNTLIKESEFRFITTGNFRSLDMIEPMIDALDKVKRKNSFSLDVIGPIVNKKLLPLLEREYVNYLGPKNLREIAVLLRRSNAFIYSHLNPPCPNSVLEAISVGLPVVGFDSGSMSELLSFSKELLAPVSKDIFQKYENFNYNLLQDKVELLLSRYDHYKKLSLSNAKKYSFEECGQNYLSVMRRYL